MARFEGRIGRWLPDLLIALAIVAMLAAIVAILRASYAWPWP